MVATPPRSAPNRTRWSARRSGASGVNVFGSGLALYGESGRLLGALGVSGDSSCADHNVTWKLRHALLLDVVPSGMSPTGDDNIVHDLEDGVSAGGWGHPECASVAAEVARKLPDTHPLSRRG